jgi:hypothetical protein
VIFFGTSGAMIFRAPFPAIRTQWTGSGSGSGSGCDGCPQLVMQSGWASCSRYPKLQKHALAWKKWTFFDEDAQGFGDRFVRVFHTFGRLRV